MWYYNKVGGKRCPIVDTWWQTETGCHMIAPLPGAVLRLQTRFLGHACRFSESMPPSSTITARKFHAERRRRKLVIRRPWPSMLRTIYGDAARYLQNVLEREIKRLLFRYAGWRPPRQGRLFLDRGADRRRAQRGRSSARHVRGGKRPGQPSRRGRSRRRRTPGLI